METLEERRVLAAAPVISEVLASNDRVIDDVDGDDSDYVELFNAGDDDMSLNRYYLTDDPEELRKWRFPDVELGAGEYLVVFASGKDRNAAAEQLHTNFRVSANGEYLALVEPDGQTIAFEYAPGIPQQLTDISYGIPTGIQDSVLLSRESTGRLLIPTSGDLEPTEPDVIQNTWLDPELDDSSWMPVTTGIGYVPPTVPVVLADSEADFSGVQGQDGWSYGTWTKNFDSDGVYDASEFGEINAERFFDEAANVWDVGLNGAPPSTEITPRGGHPAVESQGFFTHWAMRRWTSETEGEITISGTLENVDPAGDGVVGRILVNGTEIYSQLVNGTATEYSVTADVEVGDVVDFAIDAGEADNETGDETVFTAEIRGIQLRQLPEVLVADSSSDWERTDIQGVGNNWFYGYYDRQADPDQSYSDEDFRLFTATEWSRSRWQWPDDSSELNMRSTTQQSYADEDTNHWAVRRWISTVDGTLVVEYDYAMSLTRGTGTTARLFHNGTEVDMAQIEGDDRDGFTRRVTLTDVRVGDRIELAVDPLGPNDDPGSPDGEDDRAQVDVRISRVADVAESVNTDIREAMQGVSSTAYLRIPFTVDDLGKLDVITLNIKYDDAFVAYINGQRVTGGNAPDAPVFDSVALSERSPEEATLTESFDLTDDRGLFVEGENVLQIHAINADVNDSELLIEPEIVIGTLTAQLDQLRYFGVPTPGQPNGLGADRVGPQIVEVSHTPHIPQPDEAVIVTAAVTETFDQLADVQLHYSIMYDDFQTIAMTDDGQNGDAIADDSIFTATIPGGQAEPGEMIRWFIEANDTSGLTGRYPVFATPKDQDYDGTIVEDPEATSNLKIFHTFIEEFRRATSSGGTTGAIFHNGEFYSNVGFDIHGQSSSGFPTEKKSLNVDFPNDHRLLLEDDIRRMEDINLLTNFADQSKLRNTLAYEQRAMTGGGYHLAFPIHFRNNAEFFGIYDFVEDADDRWMDRLGFTPGGSLYKIYNTFNTAGGAEKKTLEEQGNDDLRDVIAGVRQGGDEVVTFIMDNVNIARMANYLAGFAITSNRDCCHKNYYAYRDTEGTGEWWFLPWDVDLSNGRNWGGFGRAYFDETIYFDNGLRTGTNNTLISRLFNNVPGFDDMYLRRVRTLMDEYVKPPGTPRDQLPLETRVDELVELMAEDARMDNELHANDNVWQSPYKTFEQATQDLLELYSAPRREWLYNTQTQADTSDIRDIISGVAGEVHGQYFIPTDDSLGTTWTTFDFDDSSWRTGPLGIGFEPRNDNYDELIRTDVTDEMEDKTSIYIRVPFTVEDPTELDGVSLRMKYEDGFVAYVNGVEVHREGLRQDEPTFDSTSLSRSSRSAVEFHNIDISEHVDAFRPGENILAVHALNSSTASSDMFMLPGLVEGRLSEGRGEVPPAQRGNPTIDIANIEFNPSSGNQQEEYLVLTNNNDASVDISDWTLDGDIQHTFDPGTVLIAGGSLYVTPNAKAFRARAEGPSGGQQLFVQGNYEGTLPNVGGTVRLVAANGELISESSYEGSVDPLQDVLRISEVMYNPLAASAEELAADNSLISEDFEFVELLNTSTTLDLDLSGVHFGNGIEFDFTGADITELAPGERVLVVSNLNAFQLRYGTEAMSRVAGAFAANTALRDDGERVTLQTVDDSIIQDFAYNDATHQGWPLLADGHGSSLQAVNLMSDFNEPHNWRASVEIGGSPAAAGQSSRSGLVINEVLSRSVDPDVDTVELYNTSDTAISLAGYALSDSSGSLDELMYYSLGDGTIPAGGYLVLTEADFNPGDGENPNDFAIDGDGEQLFLTYEAEGGGRLFADGVRFDEAAPGESFGRVPNGQGRLYPNVSTTFGSENSEPRVGPIIISEVMYAPPEPSAAALTIDPNLDSSDLEFIEITNPTDETLLLEEWRIRLGVGYDFRADVQLPAGQSIIVVPFNPDRPDNADRLAAFRAHYSLDESTTIVGGYGGQLSSAGDGIQLQRPGEAPDDAPDDFPRSIEDEVVYDNVAPWPVAIGRSLTRVAATAYGNDPNSWIVADATPGLFVTDAPGDLNDDGRVDLQDVEQLHAAGLAGDHSLDLTGDAVVDQNDLFFLLEDVIGAAVGDVNGDRLFNSSDLVELFKRGGYEDGVDGNATYLSGDFNLDGDFDSSDLVVVGQRGGYTDANAAQAASRIIESRDRAFSDLTDPLDDDWLERSLEYEALDVESLSEIELKHQVRGIL